MRGNGKERERVKRVREDALQLYSIPACLVPLCVFSGTRKKGESEKVEREWRWKRKGGEEEEEEEKEEEDEKDMKRNDISII